MIRYSLYLTALIFLIWTAATSLTQVQSTERAVIRRFGRILEHKPEQGLHIGLPWGIDRVELVPVGPERLLKIGFLDKEEKDDDVMPTGQMLTGDHNLINVQATIYYRVREDDMERYVLQKDTVDLLVARTAESLINEWIASQKVDDVIRHGKAKLAEMLLDRLPDRLKDYELGIDIKTVSIPEVSTPAQVKDAFERLGQAQTSIATKRNIAEQEAGRRRDEARSEAFKMEQRGKNHARIEFGNAVAEADSFLKRLEQYRDFARKDPDYLNALWLEEMTRLYAKMREGGRLDVLDHYLSSEGLTITQFPLQPRKK